MLIGYARVSTSSQNLDLQIAALKEAGCEKIFTDISSGSKKERSGLTDTEEALRKGDTLVVWKLDRLGRSTQHLIERVTNYQSKNIGFKSLQESIDTETPGGKLIFHVFSALAEFERDIIRERTSAGLNAARAQGKTGGRPKSIREDKNMKLIKGMHQDPNHSVSEICDIFKISRSTFYRYLNDCS